MVRELTASQLIGQFVQEFPAGASAECRQTVSGALTDTLAVAVAAGPGDASRMFAGVGRTMYSDQSGPARTWSRGGRWPCDVAAVLNGVDSHLLDYDDASSPLRIHPSALMFPALVALGESIGSTLAQVADAYVVGFEVMSRISAAALDDLYARGWHASPTIGGLGTTAACCRLLGLPATASAHAIGLAMGGLGGSRENFGTLGKAYQLGVASAAAVRAALTAAAGADAGVGSLDGDVGGFAQLYGGSDGAGLRAALGRLGEKPLALVSDGLEVKKYPSCYVTHRAVDAVLEMAGAHGFEAADVDTIDVVTNATGLVPLISGSPSTGLEAKFSLEYVLAAAVCDGRVGLATFEDEAVRRPRVRDLQARVRAREADGPAFPRWATVAITLRSGETYQRRVTVLRGSAESPLGAADFAQKVGDCLAHGGSPTSADVLVKAVDEGWSSAVGEVLDRAGIGVDPSVTAQGPAEENSIPINDGVADDGSVDLRWMGDR